MTSLDGINGWSIQTLLRGENDSKQSDEFRATPHPIQSCNSEKIRDTRVQHCLWGEGRSWTCVNWKTPQKRESVPRLLSMIVGSEFKHIADAVMFLWRPWPAMKLKNTISLNRFSIISMQWRDWLKLKKLGKKKKKKRKRSHTALHPRAC